MTFIFAKDKSLDSLKEAIKQQRTIAWSFGIMAGKKQILEDFFMASIKCDVISTDDAGTMTVSISNVTSLDYILRFKGNPVNLSAFGTVTTKVREGEDMVVTVENMWYSSAEHPVISIKIR